MASVFQINKGVSKPIMFKGLKAQYIAYLAIGLVSLLLAFAIGYVAGLSLYLLVPLIAMMGTALFFVMFRLSHRFGEHGLMKFLAKRNLPNHIKFRSRRLFTQLNKQSDLISSVKNNRSLRINNSNHGRSNKHTSHL